VQPAVGGNAAAGARPRRTQRMFRDPPGTGGVVSTANVRVTTSTFLLGAGGVVAEPQTFLVF